MIKVTGAEEGDRGWRGAGTRGRGHSRSSGVSSRRRLRLVLKFGSQQVRDSAQNRALSVSFPFAFQTRGGSGGRGEKAARTEGKEGPWHCWLPRPQTRQERAGVASASRGGSGGRG